MATAKTRVKRAPAPPVPPKRWQGFLGRLGDRPMMAGVVIVGCLALIVGAGALVVYPQGMASYHWWQAQRAAERFEFAETRRHLAYCLQVWPNSGETYYALARAYRREGDFTQARRHLLDAQRCHWSTEGIDLEQKLIQAQQGDVRSVERLLFSYLEADHPDKLLILEALVLGYLKHNFIEDAYQWSSVWIKLAPEMWQPRLLRAQALELGQKPQLALQEYQNALELNPQQPEARLQLALILLRGKQYPDALQNFDVYLRVRPDDPSALAGLARCQRALQMNDEVAATVARLLASNPDNPEACLLRAWITWDQAQPREALQWLRKSQSLAPNELETLQLLGVVLRELGQDAEAEQVESRRQKLESEMRQLEGLIKELLTIEAATDRKKTDGQDEKTRARCVTIRTTIGKTLLEQGQEKDGIGWLLSAIQEDPGNAVARKLLTDHQKLMTEREAKARTRAQAQTPQ